MRELWDLYDENRKLLNKTHVRGVPIPSGEYHLVVDVWIINKEGKILIDKRHPNKPLGGLWECPGGAVISGENSELGAIRELEEELGIKANIEELTLLHSIKLEKRFVDTYLLKKDIKINDLILQAEEVTEAKFVSIQELDKLWENNQLAIKERYKMYREKILLYIKK